MEFYKLANGVRVVLVPMPGVESLAVGVYAGTGSRFETEENNGISHFIEHMAFKGTAKFPTPRAISHLEGLGAIQNAVTSLDYTSYYCKIPADLWKQGLEVVTDLALKPLFPEPEIEIERGVILEELKWAHDRPDELIGDKLQESLFPNHPLGRNILGTEKALKSINRSQFMEYHQTHYTAGNLVVAMAGKIPDPEAVKAAVELWYGHLPSLPPSTFIPFDDTQPANVTFVESKTNLQQVFVALAVRGVTNQDPRRFTLGVLNSYLGRGFTSRFYEEIREKRGLCYSIHSGDNRLHDTGYWAVFAGLNKERLNEAITAILKEMSLTKQKLISPPSLKESKEKIRGPMLFAMENPISQMDFYAKQVLDKPHEVLTYDTVIDRVMGVTDAQVRELANDIFKPTKLTLAVVGPVEPSDQSSLAKLLEV
jgi:predicted Zn-dependent peptidase